MLGDFPGCPVVKTSPFNVRGVGSIPGWGAEIPASLLKNQNIKLKQYCNKFNKDLKKKKRVTLKKNKHLLSPLKKKNNLSLSRITLNI